MPRTKQYIESEVIEKAMQLFWRNGYSTTSVRMLEEEMGINQFSIYSSFGNKQGVFLESMKCYKKKVQEELLDKLDKSEKGVESIKIFFINFHKFSQNNETNKGCLLTNTIDEIGEKGDAEIVKSITDFALNVKRLFIKKLMMEYENEEEIIKKVNYLMVSMQGLSVASKMFDSQQLQDFIETTFENI